MSNSLEASRVVQKLLVTQTEIESNTDFFLLHSAYRLFHKIGFAMMSEKIQG
jgi:hypothetical protein